MRKCANIQSYMRRPLVMYDFATAPFWIFLCMGKFCFIFLSVQAVQSFPGCSNSLSLRYPWCLRQLRAVSGSQSAVPSNPGLSTKTNGVLSIHRQTQAAPNSLTQYQVQSSSVGNAVACRLAIYESPTAALDSARPAIQSIVGVQDVLSGPKQSHTVARSRNPS